MDRKLTDKKRRAKVVPQLSAEPGTPAAIACNVLSPSLLGASTVHRYDEWISKNIKVAALADELHVQCQAASNGDLTRAEAMLVSQAHSLDAIYNNLAGRATLYNDRLDVFERLLRLALKAQAQCRTTLETLAAIKNPPVVLARQANITSGPQMVNNGVTPSLARENASRQNKLLGVEDEQRLDSGTPTTTGGLNPAMAPLAKVHGTQDA